MTSPDEPARLLRIVVMSWRDVTHPEAGGSEVYVHEVARRWAAAGHHVTIVTARSPGQTLDEVIDGVSHRRRGGRLGVYPRALAFAAHTGGRADVVLDVVNGLPFGSPLIGRRGVVALVHHVHREQWQIIYPDWRGRVGWFLESKVTPLLYRRVPFITVSEASRRDLISLGVPATSVSVIRNGLSPHQVVGVPRSQSPRIIVLGRLVPHKQVEHVLKASAQLRDAHPGLTVDIVGSGWWRDRLVAEAAHLGVSDIVTFHGHVNEHTRDTLLARAWVLAMPSVKEGWGIAVTEAAAQATPAIGYRSSGGLKESIDDGATGWLVNNHPEFVTTLDAVLTDPHLRETAGLAARHKAWTLDWDETSAGFLRVATASARPQRSP